MNLALTEDGKREDAVLHHDQQRPGEEASGSTLALEELLPFSKSSIETDVSNEHSQTSSEVLFRDKPLALSTDCGEWPPKIIDDVRKLIVERGPAQVTSFDFPIDSKGRKFSPTYYTRKLCNGEKVHRIWLMYSIAKNAVFCFACKLFGNVNSVLAGDQGYSDWQNLTKMLTSHEKSPTHVKNCQLWRELFVRLRLNRTIDKENERLIQAETEHWNQVLKRLFCVVQFLGTQGLAFRGTTDVLNENNNGNWLRSP